MKFTKMHGIGNDYVYVDCMKEPLLRPEETARRISDRHFGIGSDGLILIGPSQTADFEMIMYNGDGSRGEMCGNGIRCVAKYVYEKGLTDKTMIAIETLAGIRKTELILEGKKVAKVKVDMGAPSWETWMDRKTCPQDAPPIDLPEGSYGLACISMGNPHCVIFMEQSVETLDIGELGPPLEHHVHFPNRTNVEFVNILNQNELSMRVWERGSGETLACGTGACAVVVAAVLRGYTADSVTVPLLGGDLDITWNRTDNKIFMTGTATKVYEGEMQDLMHG